MELMEDGNLMDKVLILIQRDMEYYTEKQTVLQETICPGVVGGKLDFPRSASFAAVKLVLWWEDEFIAAYKKDSGFLREQKAAKTSSAQNATGMVKNSDPAKFVSAVAKSSDQLLDHLHVLTQEALDHADLTVLTGTIGAAALIKNCLWCYVQRANEGQKIGVEELQKHQKKYQEMGEALAERLLDLHCRLLSLYILQDAESLDWENEKVFCESERGSYVIQMWWLYMQGTKDDLWNSVPPKMAQRVFAGMLNESLTILTVRYAHATPSKARGQLYAVDISNLLLCVAKLLPAVCDAAAEFTGAHVGAQNKLLRDIHAKCDALLACLVLRAADLQLLHKMLARRRAHLVGLLAPRRAGDAQPWLRFALSHLHPELDVTRASAFVELLTLLPLPAPRWAQLLKFVCMEECRVGRLLLAGDAATTTTTRTSSAAVGCGAFLCAGDGGCATTSRLTLTHHRDVVVAFAYVVLAVGNEAECERHVVRHLTREPGWHACLDRRHVWSTTVWPAWYEATAALAAPLVRPIADVVVAAVRTGASMYQASSIVLVALRRLWAGLDSRLYVVAALLQDLLPASVVPVGNSVLLQVLVGALYAELLERSTVVAFDLRGEGTKSTGQEIALAVAEALCAIDEDHKHTEEIDALLAEAKRVAEENPIGEDGLQRCCESERVLEAVTSLLLGSAMGKRSLKILHHFMKNNDEWLMDVLQDKATELRPTLASKKAKGLLHAMFYIGDKPFDELLVGNWTPNWQQLFMVPMGLSPERVAAQVFARWDLKDGRNQDTLVSIQRLLKPTSA